METMVRDDETQREAEAALRYAALRRETAAWFNEPGRFGLRQGAGYETGIGPSVVSGLLTGRMVDETKLRRIAEWQQRYERGETEWQRLRAAYGGKANAAQTQEG